MADNPDRELTDEEMRRYEALRREVDELKRKVAETTTKADAAEERLEESKGKYQDLSAMRGYLKAKLEELESLTGDDDELDTMIDEGDPNTD